MQKTASYFLTISVLFAQAITQQLQADVSENSENEIITSSIESVEEPVKKKSTTQIVKTPINAFTGQIVKNKVRMRLQPSLDGTILREFNRNDLVIVVGETEDFYSIRPPANMKAYIFRTFVLDNVIEGNRVNVRLEPDISSPVIGQLNAGEHVQGAVSPKDKKWLEIPVPTSSEFYISKEYIEKIGDANLLAALEKRRESINTLLAQSEQSIQIEMSKLFDQINIDGIKQNLNKIISQGKDFPEQAAKAKEILNSLHENYLHKKVAYLEKQAQIAAQNAKIAMATPPPPAPIAPPPQENIIATENLNNKMAAWAPAEQHLYDKWFEHYQSGSVDEFYQRQLEVSDTLQGILEPYNRSVKNKPGNFVLVNQSTHLPIAYLYSTRVNLHDKVGQEVTIQVAPRENNNFAYPAYFVLSVE